MLLFSIKVIPSSVPLIRMSKNSAKIVGLINKKNKIVIFYGNRQTEALVKITSELPQGMIEMDQSSIDLLMIDTVFHYDYRYANDKLIIGPVIGLLFSHKGRYLKKLLHDKKEKKKYLPYAEIMEKVGGVFYFFATDQINYQKEAIKGYVYDVKTANWYERIFPFPGVIYRKVSISKNLEKKMKGKIFNSDKFSKFKFWEMVKAHPKISLHLPETCNKINKGSLDEQLKKHDKVLLKHTKKKLGYGIYLISKEKNGYMVTKNLTYNSTYLSNSKIVKFLNKHKRNYIFQQFVPLKTFENRKIDYRLIFTKNTKEEWTCNGILGWLGAIGGFTIHTLVETNGRTLEDMLKIQFEYNSKQIEEKKKELIELGTLLATELDTPELPYIDFGFDFGLDEDQKIWIFEANVFQQLWSPLYLGDVDMYEQIINSVISYLRKEAMC